jgi:hypothetical protein
LQLTTIITDLHLASYIGHLSCYPILQRSYYTVPYSAMPLYVCMYVCTSSSYSGTVPGIIALQLIHSHFKHTKISFSTLFTDACNLHEIWDIHGHVWSSGLWRCNFAQHVINTSQCLYFEAFTFLGCYKVWIGRLGQKIVPKCQ